MLELRNRRVAARHPRHRADLRVDIADRHAASTRGTGEIRSDLLARSRGAAGRACSDEFARAAGARTTPVDLRAACEGSSLRAQVRAEADLHRTPAQALRAVRAESSSDP